MVGYIFACGIGAFAMLASMGAASVQAGQFPTAPKSIELQGGQKLTTFVQFRGHGFRGRGFGHRGLGHRGFYRGRGFYGRGFGHRGFYGRGYYGRRYYRRGFGGGAFVGGLAAGALVGGALAAQAAPGPVYAAPMGDGSIAYCQQRFRSYDSASGTYLGYDGKRHACP